MVQDYLEETKEMDCWEMEVAYLVKSHCLEARLEEDFLVATQVEASLVETLEEMVVAYLEEAPLVGDCLAIVVLAYLEIKTNKEDYLETQVDYSVAVDNPLEDYLVDLEETSQEVCLEVLMVDYSEILLAVYLEIPRVVYLEDPQAEAFLEVLRVEDFLVLALEACFQDNQEDYSQV